MKLKKYTVVWSKKGLKTFGMSQKDNDVISIEEDKTEIWIDISRSKIGRPKKRLATVYPLFDTEKEAIAHQDGNQDFEVVSCVIEI